MLSVAFGPCDHEGEAVRGAANIAHAEIVGLDAETVGFEGAAALGDLFEAARLKDSGVGGGRDGIELVVDYGEDFKGVELDKIGHGGWRLKKIDCFLVRVSLTRSYWPCTWRKLKDGS